MVLCVIKKDESSVPDRRGICPGFKEIFEHQTMGKRVTHSKGKMTFRMSGNNDNGGIFVRPAARSLIFFSTGFFETFSGSTGITER